MWRTIRRRKKPPPPGTHPESRSECIAARRTHKRYRRKHPPGTGRRIGKLRRMCRRRLTRPLVSGPYMHPYPFIRGRLGCRLLRRLVLRIRRTQTQIIRKCRTQAGTLPETNCRLTRRTGTSRRVSRPLHPASPYPFFARILPGHHCRSHP